MKKIFMTLAVALLAVSASAQVYVGGNVGIASIIYKEQPAYAVRLLLFSLYSLAVLVSRGRSFLKIRLITPISPI